MKKNIDGLEPITMEQNSEKNTEKQQSPIYALNKEDKSQYGEIIDVEQIEGTPFNIITLDKNSDEKEARMESFIAIGNRRITELNTYVKCIELIQQKQWGLICSLITLITEATVKEIEKERDIDSLVKKNTSTHNLLKAMHEREAGDTLL